MKNSHAIRSLIIVSGALVALKGVSMVRDFPGMPQAMLASSAQAADPVRATTTAPAAATTVNAEAEATAAALRARREAMEERERAISTREALMAVAEQRLAARLGELAALQGRLEAADAEAKQREETHWRTLAKLYETMRPREAATVFNELDLPVLVQVVERMGDRRAAAVLGAMQPDRVRQLTVELARLRAARPPA